MSVPGVLPATVEGLHDEIQKHFGIRDWCTLQALTRESAGIEPKNARKADAVTSSDATPLNCDPIEPGLAEAIMQAPSRVMRWMLAPPRDPSQWRTSLPPDGMDDGSWCG